MSQVRVSVPAGIISGRENKQHFLPPLKPQLSKTPNLQLLAAHCSRCVPVHYSQQCVCVCVPVHYSLQCVCAPVHYSLQCAYVCACSLLTAVCMCVCARSLLTAVCVCACVRAFTTHSSGCVCVCLFNTHCSVCVCVHYSLQCVCVCVCVRVFTTHCSVCACSVLTAVCVCVYVCACSLQSYICTRWTRLLSGWTGYFSAALDGCASDLSSQDARHSLDSASLRDLRIATDLALRATKATAQAFGRSMSSLIVLERHLWLTMTEMKEATMTEIKFPSSMLRSGQLGQAGLDQLWRASLNVSRRLRSRLKRCNTYSLNAPALLHLPVAPNPRRFSRQPNQHQPPRSPDLRTRGEIEGAYARQDTTTSLCAKDPGPRLPWIQCLRSLPDQPGRNRRGPSLTTAGPPANGLSCLSHHLAEEKNVFLVPHWPATAPRCVTAVVADKIKHKHFQK